MCVQYRIDKSLSEIAEVFDARILRFFIYEPHIFPRYVAPVIVFHQNERLIVPMSYGLIPPWEKNAKPKQIFHNARSETLTEKPSFKNTLTRSRCLIPMTGFYEYLWKGEKKLGLGRFTQQNLDDLCAAGIYSRWEKPGGGFENTFSLITKAPTSFLLESGHDRSPYFLEEGKRKRWIEDQPTFESFNLWLKDFIYDPSLTMNIDSKSRE